jgi:DNA helicase HerA-like ATPase
MADDPSNVPGKILIGKSAEKYEHLTLALGNRHGLVTGATGTGKTVTLQKLAEGFSDAGTAVFAADVKGDLSGVAMAGDSKPPFLQRAKDIGVTYTPDRFPVVFWDVFGEQGHPVRATILEMGPLLMARLLELNDVQEGVLNIVFKVADENQLPIIDVAVRRRARLGDHGEVRQRGHAIRGRHPEAVARAREAGRRQVLR